MGKKNERIYGPSEPRPVGSEGSFGKRTFFGRELEADLTQYTERLQGYERDDERRIGSLGPGQVNYRDGIP